MRRRTVFLTRTAKEHIFEIGLWIAKDASREVTLRYIERIEAYVYSFEIAAERGTRGDDIRRGLRTVGFERRLTVAFSVSGNRVMILGVFRAGQDWASALRRP